MLCNVHLFRLRVGKVLTNTSSTRRSGTGWECAVGYVGEMLHTCILMSGTWFTKAGSPAEVSNCSSLGCWKLFTTHSYPTIIPSSDFAPQLPAIDLFPSCKPPCCAEISTGRSLRRVALCRCSWVDAKNCSPARCELRKWCWKEVVMMCFITG